MDLILNRLEPRTTAGGTAKSAGHPDS